MRLEASLAPWNLETSSAFLLVETCCLEVMESMLEDLEISPSRLQKKAVSQLSLHPVILCVSTLGQVPQLFKSGLPKPADEAERSSSTLPNGLRVCEIVENEHPLKKLFGQMPASRLAVAKFAARLCWWRTFCSWCLARTLERPQILDVVTRASLLVARPY